MKETPIIRKLIQIGGSRAVSLPASWLELIERKTGTPIREVAVEVDNYLMIQAILPKTLTRARRRKVEEMGFKSQPFLEPAK